MKADYTAELAEAQRRIEETPLEPFWPEARYLEYFNNLPVNLVSSFFARDAYVKKYGFALVSRETLSVLKDLLGGGPVLDAGAGTGYLAERLGGEGVKVVAADIRDYSLAQDSEGYPFQTVHRLDRVVGHAAELLPGEFTAVLLSWPCYQSSFAYEVAQAMQAGQTLVYQGEGVGGCTGDDAFHALLRDTGQWKPMTLRTEQLNAHHVQFSGIHDWWHAYKKV